MADYKLEFRCEDPAVLDELAERIKEDRGSDVTGIEAVKTDSGGFVHVMARQNLGFDNSELYVDYIEGLAAEFDCEIDKIPIV